MRLNPIVFALLLTTAFIENECFEAGENDGESNSYDLLDLEFIFEKIWLRFRINLVVDLVKFG